MDSLNWTSRSKNLVDEDMVLLWKLAVTEGYDLFLTIFVGDLNGYMSKPVLDEVAHL